VKREGTGAESTENILFSDRFFCCAPHTSTGENEVPSARYFLGADMSFEYDNGGESEDPTDDLYGNQYCEDCKWLTEAVRDLEQQRREAIDQRNREAALPFQSPDELVSGEKLFIVRMRALEHRRNAALDVLAKHQQLEHQ
jgi:hypothetical protein